jgi:hypothetical protein
MSGPMPYLLHKSAYFEIIESLLSDPAERISMLQRLRAGVLLSDLSGFDSTNLGTPPAANRPGSGDGKTPAKRVEHLNEHWFGMALDDQGQWQKQRNAFPTGFWTDYQGDPEAIMRAAMIRGIEVSLGIPPGEEIADQCCLERRWPIDLYWICQGPWFQCWVLWRQSDATSAEGHVTVLMTTPAAYGLPLTSQITRPVDGSPPPYTAPEYSCPPPPAARLNRRGMWVIGHEDYAKTVVCSSDPSEQGDIVWPRIEWRAVRPEVVVCVSPAEWEAGVLHDGRPYTAPTP